ncbi:MAG: hypothetical protein IPO92_03505 [Saprospiraceae bacterium]|nr:hypothetical protein [Saprospiraceae bacterium]
MKNFFVSLLLFLSFFMSAFCQNNVKKPAGLIEQAYLSGAPKNISVFSVETNRSTLKIPDDIKDYTLLKIDKKGILELSKGGNSFISLTIPTQNRDVLTLELVEFQPFADDFKVILAPSMENVKVNTGKHFRGIIKGQKSSVVAISFFEDHVMGFISHPFDAGNLVIGKVSGADSHILYQDHQIASRFDFDCKTKDGDVKYTSEQLRDIESSSRSLTDCARLYLEVDNDIYLSKGSNVTTVTSFVTGIFNQLSTLYSNEQINTTLSELVIWTVASPYNSNSSLGMLNAFTAYRQGFNGNLAQLWSYKASGGVAYVDGLCRPNPDYSMSYAGIQSTYQNVPTYSWTVEVVTHEFGHLFGSQHTHACVWNGNNTAIDGCYTTEGGCGNPGLPSGGGTIMSYCHLTGAGINFSNGFGPQPGNIIRSEMTTATCLTPCGSSGGGGSGGGGGGGGNECTQNTLTLNLNLDNYPSETTWNVKNGAGAILYSGGPYSTPNTLISIPLCLPTACFTFTILDQYGDGICCVYGSGYYNIKQGTNTLISGGQFGASEIKPFCATGAVTPTCTDGIQNGSETGVDCGGTCPPCIVPNCTDGILNNGETSIDCGGPNCPACPSCTDGIRNGLETGVDCGAGRAHLV